MTAPTTVQGLSPDRTLMAVGLTLIYAAMVGFSDNYVRAVADDTGLWQFHATRSFLALAMMGLAAPFLGLQLRPRNIRAVAARALLQGIAIMIYFGALAFMPVAVAAAGLFTAPVFVLLISRLVYGERIGPARLIAVMLGFLGVVLVLGPRALAGAGITALVPALAGAVYAMANIATRRWCAEESAGTLLAGFFVSLGLIGLLGLAVLSFWPQPVPAGSGGFLLRGFVWPDGEYLAWMLLHASFSAVGVGLCTRAYLMANAGRVSVLEYMVLPSSAFWGQVIWGDSLGALAWYGIALIVLAGAIIALRAQEQER
ncbi:DMT family transporter [Pseudogemmobacter bohemicus]|uniref:DMT family transporter n=1 Tax=Pseudogemmobacter bohemicus TaxID=2250708 RepID=UPI000DD3D9AC|nr:DMT family transporter [Pseudogemmobacter bohemicus]